jgi:hypothetical protein
MVEPLDNEGESVSVATCINGLRARIRQLKAQLVRVRAEVIEECATAIRQACAACGGTGAAHQSGPDTWDECEYCGRPIAAIRALHTKGML